MKLRLSLDLDYPSDVIDEKGFENILNGIAKDSSVLCILKDQMCFNMRVEKLSDIFEV